MNGHVAMSLFESVIFSNVVQIIPANDDGSLHFHLGHHTRQDPTPDGDVPCEGTLFVNVGSIRGL